MEGNRQDFSISTFDGPSAFVLGPAASTVERKQPSVRSSPVVPANVTSVSLQERLASDLGELLNRTDISDCFLNVKGNWIRSSF